VGTKTHFSGVVFMPAQEISIGADILAKILSSGLEQPHRSLRPYSLARKRHPLEKKKSR